jgi:hypothetical protein
MKTISVLALLPVMVPAFASVALGIHKTPMSADACQIEPYAWRFGATLDSLDSCCKKHGYDVADLILRSAGLSPDVTLEDFVFHLANGDGVFGLATHGSPEGFAIEVYEYTVDGQAARDTALAHYRAGGYTDDEIYPREKQGQSYHISVSPTLISNCFQSARSIVHCGACDGWMHRVSWTDAREVLAYDGITYFSTIRSEANTFWSRMNGYEGKDERFAGAAALGLTLSRAGYGNTVLSPTVEAYYPPEYTTVGEDSVNGWVAFDTAMDITIDPAWAIEGCDCILAKNERWARGDWPTGETDTLKYTVKSIYDGTGEVIVNYLAMSDGGMSLDGNQDPPGSDGVGPNADSYILEYDCDYTDPNYAARFASSWAYRQDDFVIVGWHTEAELGTSKYLIEGSEGDAWRVLGEVACGEVIAPDVYKVSVEGGHEYYRVVELDAGGRRGEFRPLRVQADEPEFVPEVVTLAPRFRDRMTSERIRDADCHASPAGIAPYPHVSDGDVPDWVFYGPDTLLAECLPAIDWFELNGLAVDTVHAPSPDY